MENTQKHYTRGEINKANQSSSIGLIIRQKEPKVLETPLDRVDSFLTPTELFYVRSHSPAPKLELASYRLHTKRGGQSRGLSGITGTKRLARKRPSRKNNTVFAAAQYRKRPI